MAPFYLNPVPASANPTSPSSQTVTHSSSRITVLTDRLFRLEHSPDGSFEDRPSTFALNRAFPQEAEYEVKRDGAWMEVRTNRVQVFYDGGEFSASGLKAMLRKLSGL